MKIAINAIYYREPPTGISRYVLNLMEWVQKIDAQNQYVFLIAEKFKKKFRQYPAIPVPYHEKNIFSMYKTSRAIRNIVLSEKIDIFHSPHYVIPARLNCAKIITFHDTSAFEFPEFFPWVKRMYWKHNVPRAVRDVDTIIADSHTIKEKILTIFPGISKPIPVIYLGVGFQQELENTYSSNNTNIPIKKPFILFVGIISPRKNIFRLVSAYKQLVEQHCIPHKLVLVGGYGWMEKKFFKDLLTHIVKNELVNKIHITGTVSDNELHCWYENAELLVHPSLGEGFGLPVLEAMASGLPVAVANDSSLPELVSNAGLLFDPYSVDNMAKTIFRLIQDKKTRENLIKLGKERIQNFSWRNTASETIRVYQEVYNSWK